jgi:hypothetical protein
MSRRPSLRASLTTLAAAGVLVAGLDLASYAATGHAFVLGHANMAGGTTSLKNTGRGPALSLNSAKSAPPVKVTSSKMVKHLNANMVGGRTAARLAPKTIRLPLGQTGTTFTGDGSFHLRSVTVPKGTYAIAVSGLVLEDNPGTNDGMECLVADKAMLLGALNGGPLTFAQVYEIDGSRAGTINFGVFNGQNPAQSIPRGPLAFGCSFNGAGEFHVVRGLTFTLKPISVSNKSSKPIVLNRSARHARLSFR